MFFFLNVLNGTSSSEALKLEGHGRFWRVIPMSLMRTSVAKSTICDPMSCDSFTNFGNRSYKNNKLENPNFTFLKNKLFFNCIVHTSATAAHTTLFTLFPVDNCPL